MAKKVFLSGYVLILVVLGASVAFALDPMGPPMAALKQGQWGVGLEYFFEEGDLKLNDGKLDGSPQPPVTMKTRVHMVTATLGYGIWDNWEAFLRIGSGLHGRANGDYGSDEAKFNGDGSFVLGCGAKATFYEQQKLKVGGLCQMSWSEHNGDMKHIYSGGTALWSADVTTIELQFTVGPTYQWTDTVSIYGGPFFNFIDGDADAEYEGTMEISYDIHDASYFGGYIGTLIDLTDDLSCTIEYLHTATDDAIGAYLLWKR